MHNKTYFDPPSSPHVTILNNNVPSNVTYAEVASTTGLRSEYEFFVRKGEGIDTKLQKNRIALKCDTVIVVSEALRCKLAVECCVCRWNVRCEMSRRLVVVGWRQMSLLRRVDDIVILS